MKVYLSFYVFLLASFSVAAQAKKAVSADPVSSAETGELSKLTAKPHFLFHFARNTKDTIAYYKAAYYYASKFNQFRYYDRRRIIPVGSDGTTIELFSSKELAELYNKRITNGVRKEDEDKISIRFDFTNGIFKEQLIN